MLKYIKKYWVLCLLAPLFMVGEVAMDLIQPDMMADIVDKGVLPGDFSLIVTVGIRMILTVIIGGFFGVLCGVATLRSVARGMYCRVVNSSCFTKICAV